MTKSRIIAHVWMFILIMLGIVMAFYFIKPVVLFSRANRYYLMLVTIPLGLFVFLNLTSALYYRYRNSFCCDNIEKYSRNKEFGRMVHPTCTTLAILAWIYFIFSPDLRTLMAVIWISIVICSWIKVEKEAYTDKPHIVKDISGP